ncbi:hypothetical protein [Herpetosiphon sp. NSE202]|uniref:hypothetical protein n=1 Tax=Herpetosiphon sp. NSE202 TaxID=3351349 RepID=UPI0036388012
MTVYKSPVGKYGIPFIIILLIVTVIAATDSIIAAMVCLLLALIPIGFTWLAYKWKFVAADDYMQIDSIVDGKKINWNDIIAVEDMTHNNGMYQIRAVSKTQIFAISRSMLKPKDFQSIVTYMIQKAEEYKIPFNRNVPALQSIYYRYNPNIVSKFGSFSPPLQQKASMWAYALFVGLMIGCHFFIQQIDNHNPANSMNPLFLIAPAALAAFHWAFLLMAQFPQNLRAIEHNQREQHDQMFVPTVTSAQPYRLPFALVSLILLAVLGWIYWYLTN